MSELATSSSSEARPVVAVDLDEVLGRFLGALVEFHNSTYGTALAEADFRSYRFADTWGGSDEEAADKVHRFFESHYFKEHIHVVAGSREGLLALGKTHDLYIVTSRQHMIEEDTRQWVETHFGGIFKGVFFGNHWGVQGVKRSKADMCKEIGARVLIDDSVQYVSECAAVLDMVLLFGDYPWNQCPSSQLPTNVRRAGSWEEVVAQIQTLSS